MLNLVIGHVTFHQLDGFYFALSFFIFYPKKKKKRVNDLVLTVALTVKNVLYTGCFEGTSLGIAAGDVTSWFMLARGGIIKYKT